MEQYREETFGSNGTDPGEAKHMQLRNYLQERSQEARDPSNGSLVRMQKS